MDESKIRNLFNKSLQETDTQIDIDVFPNDNEGEPDDIGDQSVSLSVVSSDTNTDTDVASDMDTDTEARIDTNTETVIDTEVKQAQSMATTVEMQDVKKRAVNAPTKRDLKQYAAAIRKRRKKRLRKPKK